MKIVSYFESDAQQELLEKISQCDWGAACFLRDLLRDGKFFDTLGGEGDVYLLMDGEKLVSFLTLARQDSVRDEGLFPWIGFVYTAPEYRGHHYAGQLLAHAENVAREQGHERVYIATDFEGLYEKYGYTYQEDRIDCWGDDMRVLYKKLK